MGIICRRTYLAFLILSLTDITIIRKANGDCVQAQFRPEFSPASTYTEPLQIFQANVIGNIEQRAPDCYRKSPPIDLIQPFSVQIQELVPTCNENNEEVSNCNQRYVSSPEMQQIFPATNFGNRVILADKTDGGFNNKYNCGRCNNNGNTATILAERAGAFCKCGVPAVSQQNILDTFSSNKNQLTVIQGNVGAQTSIPTVSLEQTSLCEEAVNQQPSNSNPDESCAGSQLRINPPARRYPNAVQPVLQTEIRGCQDQSFENRVRKPILRQPTITQVYYGTGEFTPIQNVEMIKTVTPCDELCDSPYRTLWATLNETPRATPCPATCESSCSATCESSCPATCETSCPATCETSCPATCETSCATPCATCKTSYVTPCAKPCMNPCANPYANPCMTSCANRCVTPSSNSRVNQFSPSCATPYASSCQNQRAMCETSRAPECATQCAASTVTSCSTPCSTLYSCASPYATSCSKPCEKICATSCLTPCGTSCATSCSTPCETSCATPCARSCLTPCGTSCTIPSVTSYSTPCATSCATSCLTPCETSCETPCATSCSTPCETSCENSCATPCNVESVETGKMLVELEDIIKKSDCDISCDEDADDKNWQVNLVVNLPELNVQIPPIVLVPEEGTKLAPTVPNFSAYPPPPIIVEGSKRSRTNDWLPLLLVALLDDDCCCGNGFNRGGCCRQIIPVPYPRPLPRKPIKNNDKKIYKNRPLN